MSLSPLFLDKQHAFIESVLGSGRITPCVLNFLDKQHAFIESVLGSGRITPCVLNFLDKQQAFIKSVFGSGRITPCVLNFLDKQRAFIESVLGSGRITPSVLNFLDKQHAFIGSVLGSGRITPCVLNFLDKQHAFTHTVTHYTSGNKNTHKIKMQYTKARLQLATIHIVIVLVSECGPLSSKPCYTRYHTDGIPVTLSSSSLIKGGATDKRGVQNKHRTQIPVELGEIPSGCGAVRRTPQTLAHPCSYGGTRVCAPLRR
jgi:hypothetical protein